MSLVAAWLLFPLLLLVLSAGSGLLVERAAGTRLPGPLLAPVGLALMIVVANAATYWEQTAQLATPLVIAGALLGSVLARERLRGLVPDLWPALAAAGVFATFAAPVVLSGEASFTGYTLLGDTAVHFVLVDRLAEHGRDLAGLAPSSYRAALRDYFASAYPLGTHSALAAVRPLVGQDVAWVFQPFLAFLSAMTALAIYTLLGSLSMVKPARAAIAFLGAQPALVYAYALQGGIKEIATVFAINLVFALAPLVLAARGGVRFLVPLAVVTAAGMAVIGLAFVLWLGPLLVALALVIAIRRGSAWLRPTAREAGFLVSLVCVLSIPVILQAGNYLDSAQDAVTTQSEFGNLLGPLRKVQAIGIWPTGDFRFELNPSNETGAYVLIGVAIGAALIGLAWALRRRALFILLWVAASAIAWTYVTWRGSPWADAKALAIVSPTIVVVSLLGCFALFERARWLGAAAAGAVAFGVLWSNALGFHDARIAPRDRLHELQTLGERLDGRGPVLYTEFEEYGKHFLRKADPTGWSESFQDGTPSGIAGTYVDLDRIPVNYLVRYPTLVLRRSPARSRPPVPFRLAGQTRHYEVWRRVGDPARVIARLPLGGGDQAAAKPRCAEVDALAAKIKEGAARLAYVPRPRALVLQPSHGPLPAGWVLDKLDPTLIHTPGRGRISLALTVERGAPYEAWLRGSFGRPVRIDVDGRKLGSAGNELNGPGQYEFVGRRALGPGEHTVVFSRGGGSLRPGDGGDRLLGPVVFVPTGTPAALPPSFASPRRPQKLCRGDQDWVEGLESP